MILNKEFILNLTYFGMTIEFLTALLSTIYRPYYKNIPVLKYLPYFLWYMFLNEILGTLLREVFEVRTHLNYNIYGLINYTYFLLVYRNNIKNITSKKIISGFILCFMLLHGIDLFIENYHTQAQTFPNVIASLFLMTAILFYFIQIINSKKVHFIYKDILFWISVGMLLYYLSNTPYRIIRNYYQRLSQSYIMLLTNHCLAIIMYLCFCVGFIVSKKKNS